MQTPNEVFDIPLRKLGRGGTRPDLRTPKGAGEGLIAEILHHHIVEAPVRHCGGEGVIDGRDVTGFPGRLAPDVKVRKGYIPDGLAHVKN